MKYHVIAWMDGTRLYLASAGCPLTARYGSEGAEWDWTPRIDYAATYLSREAAAAAAWVGTDKSGGRVAMAVRVP